MRARALVCDADRELQLAEVETAEPESTDVVVDTSYSGVSIGTELNLIRGDVSWGPYPICTGYQAVGTVERVGDDVDGFAVGETVYYRDNRLSELADGTDLSATAGTHCSKAVVDPSESGGIAPLPAGVDERVGSTFVMPAVGHHGVDMAGVGYADTVVVQGAGLIGLGVVAAASQRGAEVVAVEPIEERRAVAATLGAEHLVDPGEADVVRAVEDLTGDGADVVFEATGVADLIETGMELCRDHGTFVFQGDYGATDVSFYYRTPHHKQLTTYFPCNDGLAPCRRAVLRNVANDVLHWEETLTHDVDAADAPAFYEGLLADGPGDVIGATVSWPAGQ